MALRQRFPKGKLRLAQALEGHGAQMLDSELGDDLLAWAEEFSLAKP